MKAAPTSRAAKSVRKDPVERFPTESERWSGSAHVVQGFGDAQRVHLTQREKQVLALLCEGLANKLIARRLKISSGTVKVHISNIFRALHVSNRLQAVLLARCWELVQQPEADTVRVRHLDRARHR
jgi:two-component system, NarL family, nitrate/nitrite response regulator NarL